jgi:hypothetical protein
MFTYLLYKNNLCLIPFEKIIDAVNPTLAGLPLFVLRRLAEAGVRSSTIICCFWLESNTDL